MLWHGHHGGELRLPHIEVLLAHMPLLHVEMLFALRVATRDRTLIVINFQVVYYVHFVILRKVLNAVETWKVTINFRASRVCRDPVEIHYTLCSFGLV